MLTVSEERPVSVIRTIDFVLELTRAYVAGVDMGDGGSVDSGRPETPDTDESSEVSVIFIYLFILASPARTCVIGWVYNYSDVTKNCS